MTWLSPDCPERANEIKRSVADIKKALSELQFRPTTSLENDLADLWKWHLENTPAK